MTGKNRGCSKVHLLTVDHARDRVQHLNNRNVRYIRYVWYVWDVWNVRDIRYVGDVWYVRSVRYVRNVRNIRGRWMDGLGKSSIVGTKSLLHV